MAACVKSVCVLKGTGEVHGVVHFHQEGDGPVTDDGTVYSLTDGKHSFHIHAYSDSTNSCVSDGPHFNPEGKTHGAPEDAVRLDGPKGSYLPKFFYVSMFRFTSSNGVANISFSDKVISLHGPHNIIDDLGKGGNDESLVTGNAGGRLACGVIGICP
uniref:Superoxide dismutase [Cu-Zn] n=1 Tax=Leptobrachium leishanense TaxID=445787 RepID=A0A8C5R2I0_9ANUR